MSRLDRLLTFYCFKPMNKLSPAENPAIPILMYHSISDGLECSHPYFWINTSRKRFAEQMRYLKESDYKVISLADAVEILRADQGEFPRSVVLTFDDGYHDFLKNAWPVLEQVGFNATVFVSTAFIGNSRKHFNGRECLVWSEVRELHNRGIYFGSHTASHSKLCELQWKEVRRELLDSRLRLEDELQTSARSFAYPYAFPQEDQGFVLRFRQELIDQGYLTAVTSVIGRARRKSDPLYLRRLPVNDGDDRQLFKAKLAGDYDWMYGVQYLSKIIKSKESAKK